MEEEEEPLDDGAAVAIKVDDRDDDEWVGERSLRSMESRGGTEAIRWFSSSGQEEAREVRLGRCRSRCREAQEERSQGAQRINRERGAQHPDLRVYVYTRPSSRVLPRSHSTCSKPTSAALHGSQRLRSASRFPLRSAAISTSKRSTTSPSLTSSSTPSSRRANRNRSGSPLARRVVYRSSRRRASTSSSMLS